MRREISGLLVFFLVVFTLVSLVSYSPDDPSIHNATDSQGIANLFGFLGAHLAGLLVGLIGLAAFWIPFLLLMTSIRLFTHQEPHNRLVRLGGSVLLIVASAALLSLMSIPDQQLPIFNRRFPAGGMIGTPLAAILHRYAHTTGSAAILALAWVIGLMGATRFSPLGFAREMVSQWARAITLLEKWRQRRQKAMQRVATDKAKVEEAPRQIRISALPPKPVKQVPVPKQALFDFIKEGRFQLPSVNLLEDPAAVPVSADDANLMAQSRLLEKKLQDFGVQGKVVAVSPGPVVTTFEYEPAPGVKINKIVNLSDDLALALRALSIRIVAPIPGKAVIGIEVPNTARAIVGFNSIIVSPAFQQSKSMRTLCLGKDIVGHPVAADLARMPHLLIAGATGSGKSVALNTMICSFLFKAGPDAVKMIMVDPKRIELSTYDGIPHLITPVVTDAKKATNALFWAVREMERRYELLSVLKAKNIGQNNKKVEKGEDIPEGATHEKLPLIVVIIDELADLMMVASRDVEVSLTRLAQMARASGIHLILATQRPSVDVLTGIIKANFPTRLTFQVSSKTDSRTIIDANGAENLLGAGDMLFLPPGTAGLQRIHGAYISEEEIGRITEHWRKQQAPEYMSEVTAAPASDGAAGTEEDFDDKYDEAVALVTKTRQASISMVQRHLRIGYNRAARIIEMMEKQGVVGPADGVKPREVLVRGYDE